MKIKGDAIFVVAILLLAGGLWLGFRLLPANDFAVAVVKQNQEIIGRYPLNEDMRISISDHQGGYNMLIIAGGEAAVTDSDCSDRLCVRQNAVSLRGESIICLPHKLMIQIENGEDRDLDGVAY